MRRFEIGSLVIEVRNVSITELGEVMDVLVSSDDNHLTHSGGVSRALWTAAGGELWQFVLEDAPELRLGDVYVTPAYRLPAQHLFHAVTIDFDANRRLGPREARDLYGAVLDHAARLNCHTIALPLLGSGAARLGVSGSALAAADVLNEFCRVPSSVRSVIITAPGDAFETCTRTFEEHLVSRPPLDALLGRAAHAIGGPAGDLFLRAQVEIANSPLAAADQWAPLLLDASLQALLQLALNRAAEAVSNKRVTREQVLHCGDFVASGTQILPRENSARLSAGRLLSWADALLNVVGSPLPRNTVISCHAAVRARNQLAHSTLSDPDGEEAKRALFRAVTELLVYIVDGTASATDAATVPAEHAQPREHANTAVPEDAPRTTSAPETISLAVSAVTGPAKSVAAPTVGVSGTAHVRRFHRFLCDHLVGEARGDLLKTLRQEGYRGDDEMCLLEFCVRMPDPVAFLASEFSARELRAMLREETGVDVQVGADDRVLAARLLDSLGYPVAPETQGLESVFTRLRTLQRGILTSDTLEIRGAVNEASSHLEHVVQVLLRFLCKAAFKEPPETYFVRRRHLDAGRSFDRCSLGTLLDLLGHLVHDLEDGSTPHVAVFQRDFDMSQLCSSRNADLPRLRNAFAHFERDQKPLPLEEIRKAAAEFFAAAIDLVERLRAPTSRIFPRNRPGVGVSTRHDGCLRG